MRFIEASAKADVNVTEAFQAIAQQVIDRIPRGAERGDERGDNWRGSDAHGNDPDFSGGKYRRGGEYAKDIVGF